MDWQQITLALVAAAVALIVAAATGLKGVLLSYFDYLSDRIKRWKYSHGLQKLAEFYAAFDEVCNISTVERFMLLDGRDSGGLPEPGRPYTIRCLRGNAKVVGKPNPFVLYGFDLQIDAHYADMLNKIVQNGHIVLKSDELPECLIKNFYAVEGVTVAFIGYVGIVDNRLIYASFGRYSGDFSKTDLVAFQLGMAKLRSKLDG